MTKDNEIPQKLKCSGCGEDNPKMLEWYPFPYSHIICQVCSKETKINS